MAVTVKRKATKRPPPRTAALKKSPLARSRASTTASSSARSASRSTTTQKKGVATAVVKASKPVSGRTQLKGAAQPASRTEVAIKGSRSGTQKGRSTHKGSALRHTASTKTKARPARFDSSGIEATNW